MTKSLLQTFSKRLRELRLEAGMTQEELAKRAGISVKYLQNLESKEPKNPTLLTMGKIAYGLKIPVELLFT